jgi:Cu(I)/Ag(I) efflux system membrane protein CusA/SilA
MVSSTLLTLIVIPAIFALVKGIGLQREDDSNGRALPPAALVERKREVPEPVA